MTIQTQHTPGPWTTSATPSSDLYNIRNISGANAEHIGVVACPVAPREMPQSECLANAALIAAAPDLLQCARMLAMAAAEGEIKPDEQSELLAMARAAIAKATGAK